MIRGPDDGVRVAKGMREGVASLRRCLGGSLTQFKSMLGLGFQAVAILGEAAAADQLPDYAWPQARGRTSRSRLSSGLSLDWNRSSRHEGSVIHGPWAL
jgi:hypothetical protein